MSTRLKLGAALAVTALVVVGFAATPGTSSLPPDHVAYHSETGSVRFLGSTPGKPIARPSGLEPTAAPTTVARAFLDRYGGAFGIQEQARELRVTSVRAASNARDVVRFQQVHTGVPVLGGELVVDLDGDRNLLSLTGEALASPDISVVPRVLPAAARDAALRAVA
jgi:Zn-dependent metalloprotease